MWTASFAASNLPTGAPVTTYFENGILTRSGETVEALGPTLMGDSINEYSGGLEFTHTDVSLPGNNVLPVAVGRHIAMGTRQAAAFNGHFGDWDLDIPRLHTVASSTGTWYGNGWGTPNLNRCSQLQPPPNAVVVAGTKTIDVSKYQYWDGYHLYIPGSGDQTMLGRVQTPGNPAAPANTTQPTDGLQYPVVTKQHWQFSCLSTLERGAGEGFVAHAPDGTRYQFDHMVVRAHPSMKVAVGANLARIEVWILPTQITDRFGNWVRYAYAGDDGWRVSSITSSDGRSITFTYGGGGNRIQSIYDGTRTWSYTYDANGALQTVVQPDSSRWTFSLFQLERDPFSSPDPDCNGDDVFWDALTRTGTITHPSGAVGTFNLKMTMHGRSNVPGTQARCTTALASRYFTTYSLVSKTLSGPGMPAMTWSYAYSEAVGSYAPCNGCAATKSVTVTDPSNNVSRNTYGTRFGIDDGMLLASEDGFVSGVPLRTTTYAYQNAGPNPIGYGNTFSDSMSALHMPQSRRDIVQQGIQFTQTAGGFDAYARPTTWTKFSTLGYSKTETTSYYDNTNLWVLGQIAGQTIAGIQAASTDFNATTALPNYTTKFGKLQNTYAFNADGTLASIKDGLNHATSFANYKRGLPQNITFADNSGISAVVNNIGTIASVTNEVAATWTFGYDAMGRLSRKAPPGGYYTTGLVFEQVATPEFGLEGNHWRQTISSGNAVTVNYFDARWRKRITLTYDAADRAATQRMQRFDYDPYNRVSFAAYPARSVASITDPVPGTATVYDPLGRVAQTISDSELGPLATNNAYLTGFQRRVTDPRGNVTTTAFQSFDEPDESGVTMIGAPEGVNVTFNRDVFGKTLSITKSGPYAGSTLTTSRQYVYDANQLLCKTIEPELGATVQALDAANNVSWRATGLNLLSSSSCDQASVPGAKIVAFSYDARNRNTGTGFGDGSPAIGRSYTADGLPWTVTSNGSAWTYGYDGGRLLAAESLSYSSGTYNIGRSYDGYMHLSQLTYPDSTTLAYAPNALGEPTQAGGYASGVTYHPNGQIAGYTLGNGTVHSLTQNVRGLPSVNRDAGVMQDQYAYDANGNIASITDQQEGVATRSMAYDGLDRLTVANAPNVWGNASYTYDPLGNIRSSVVGSRSTVHGYDASNRLATLTTNGAVTGFAYDGQGNITGRGTQGFYFDQGNRMQLAAGKASYTYDGLGRRVSISANDGSYRTQVYSRAGQLLYGTQQGGSTPQSIRYIYLGGKVIAQVSSAAAQPTYLFTDVLGSPVASAGTVPATVVYSCPSGWSLSGTTCTQGSSTQAASPAFGCVSGTLSGAYCNGALTRTRYEAYGRTAAGAVPDGIGFTGHVNDADTGLVYMQQRYYDPIAARFMSVDPIVTDAKTGKGFNVYEYASSNPYRFTDPDGRQACSTPECFAKIPPGMDGPVDEHWWPLFDGERVSPPSPPAGAPSGGGGSAASAKELDDFLEYLVNGHCSQCLTGTVPLPFSIGSAAKGVAAGEAGAFGALKGVKGDGLTAHHMPQAAAGRTDYNEGGALVMTQAEHVATRTYGSKGVGTLQSDAGLSFRDVLARDIRDVRSIVGSKYNEGLRDLTDYYRGNFPDLMGK